MSVVVGGFYEKIVQGERNSRPGNCNLLDKAVVISIEVHFIKKVLNGCNLGFKAVVIEEQNQTNYLNRACAPEP